MQIFFDIAPLLFLILIPAITMRMFAEERRSGTIELLFTQPISDVKLIAAKFLACEVLLLIVLLPTLVYFWSVWSLGMPDGKIDVGASPRASLGLLACSKAQAVLSGRDYVLPEDVQHMFLPVMAHRMVLSPEAKMKGVQAEQILLKILQNTPVPVKL